MRVGGQAAFGFRKLDRVLFRPPVTQNTIPVKPPSRLSIAAMASNSSRMAYTFVS